MITQAEIARLLLRNDAHVRRLNIEDKKNYLNTLNLELVEAEAAAAEAKEIMERALIRAKRKPQAKTLAILDEAQKNYAEAQRKYNECQKNLPPKYKEHDAILKKLEADYEEGQQLYDRVSRHWQATTKPFEEEEQSFSETKISF